MRSGLTLLELIIVLAAVGVIVLIALPTMRPSADEENLEFAKEQLLYLHAREQEYFNLHGKYAPLSMIAADPSLGPNLDKRFALDENLVEGIVFKGPRGEGVVYDIIAQLPDGSSYKIDQTGEVRQMELPQER